MKRLSIDFANMTLSRQLLALSQIARDIPPDALRAIRAKYEAHLERRRQQADAPDVPEFVPTAEDWADYRRFSEELERRRRDDEQTPMYGYE